jgi:Uma2 family endonuclease
MAQQLQRTAGQTHPQSMTYEEYLEWADEETRAEWVDGEVIVFMPPTVRHADVVVFLVNLISYVVRRRGLGRVLAAAFEMKLAMIPSSRDPDVAFVANEHLDLIRDGRLDGPADFIVEVLSPDSVTRDRRDKRREYARAGVREYLIVDGREGQYGVSLLRLTADRTYGEVVSDPNGLLWSDVLPEFWIDPEWFAEDPMPDPFEIGDRILSAKSN